MGERRAGRHDATGGADQCSPGGSVFGVEPVTSMGSLMKLIRGSPEWAARFSEAAIAGSKTSSSTVPSAMCTVLMPEAKSKTIASTFGAAGLASGPACEWVGPMCLPLAEPVVIGSFLG
jgi:hypothetical protein